MTISENLENLQLALLAYENKCVRYLLIVLLLVNAITEYWFALAENPLAYSLVVWLGLKNRSLLPMNLILISANA